MTYGSAWQQALILKARFGGPFAFLEIDMAHVKLTTNGLQGQIAIAGIDLSKVVTGVSIDLHAGKLPQVNLMIAAVNGQEFEFSEAGLTVGGATLPLEVEVALYRYLVEKHGPVEIKATSLYNLRVNHGARI